MKNKHNPYILPLLIFSFLVSLYGFYIGTMGENIGNGASYTWGLVFSILVAYWIKTDSKEWPAFDWPAYIFLLWPIILPFYLYKTRGVEGLLIFAGVCAIFTSHLWLNYYGYWYFYGE